MDEYEHGQALHNLLTEAAPVVARRAAEALGMGADWGVLVALPSELGAETHEEEDELAAASDAGIFVGVIPIRELVLLALPLDPSRGLVDQLLAPATEGHVQVLVVLGKEVARYTARADPATLAARDRDTERRAKIQAMLAQAETEILRLTREGQHFFVVVLPEENLLDRLRGVSASARDAARAAGLYVGAHSAADLVIALPFERLGHDEALRATKRFLQPMPAGGLRVVAVLEGVMTVATVDGRPGCLSPAMREPRTGCPHG